MDVLGLTISLSILYICMGRDLSVLIEETQDCANTGIETIFIYVLWPGLLLVGAFSMRD